MRTKLRPHRSGFWEKMCSPRVPGKWLFRKKYLHQGCLVTDYLVFTPNMNTYCDRGKVGLICFVAPQKSIFLWRPPLGFNFQMSKGVNLSPLVNPENEHKLKKKENVKTIQNQIEFRLRANRDTPSLRMIRVSYYLQVEGVYGIFKLFFLLSFH